MVVFVWSGGNIMVMAINIQAQGLVVRVYTVDRR